MWAFEWHDIKNTLRIFRGEPLFYCQFETVPQDRPIHTPSEDSDGAEGG